MKKELLKWGIRSLIVAFLLPTIYTFWLLVEGWFVGDNIKKLSFGLVFGLPFGFVILTIASLFVYLEQPFRKEEKYRRIERPIILVLSIVLCLIAAVNYAMGLSLGSAMIGD